MLLWSNSDIDRILEVFPGESNINNGFSEFGLSDLIGFKGTDYQLSIIKVILVVHGMH